EVPATDTGAEEQEEHAHSVTHADRSHDRAGPGACRARLPVADPLSADTGPGGWSAGPVWDPPPRTRRNTMPDTEPTTGAFDDQLAARLLHQRVVVLGREVDDAIAQRICAHLLLLSAEDPR